MIIRKPITKPVMRPVLTSLSTAASEAASALAVPPSLRSLLFHDDGTATEYPAYYTEEEWAEHSHLLKDYSLGVGDLREKRLGYCYDFDGVDDYVDCGTNPSLEPSSTLSFSGWIYVQTSVLTYRPVFGKYTNNGTLSNGYGIRRGNNSTTYQAWVSGKIATFGLNLNAWNHVTVVFDLSTGGTVYVNSVSVATLPAGSIVHAGNLTIGALSGGSTFWDGKLSDVQIYNYALTPQQVAALYAGTLPATKPIAHYPLQEESGATAYDISGNGNHGTILNAVTSGVGSIHQPDAGVVKSYANDEGYSLNARVLNNTRSFGDVITFKCQIPSTETQVVLLHQTGADASKYAGVAAQGLATDALSDATSLLVDGISITMRDELYLAICDGEIHEVSMTMDSNYPSWTSARFGQYTGGTYALVEGKIWDVKVNGNAADVEYQVVPAASATQDAIGGTLTYTGRCPNYGLAKGPAWQGGGSAVYVDLAQPILPTTADSFKLEFWFRVSTTPPATRVILSQRIDFGSSYSYVGMASNGLITTRLHGLSLNSSVAYSDGVWRKLTAEISGSTYTLTIGEDVFSTSGALTATANSNAALLARSGDAALGIDAELGPVSITTGGVTTTYSPIEGTRNVAVTRSDGTYAVIADAVKNGALATLYSDGDGSWQLPEIANGAHFDGTGLYPAAPGASVAANGNALNIPANKHPIGLLVDRTGGVAAPFDYQSGTDGYTNEAFSDVPPETTLNKRGLSIYAADRYGAALEDIQS